MDYALKLCLCIYSIVREKYEKRCKCLYCHEVTNFPGYNVIAFLRHKSLKQGKLEAFLYYIISTFSLVNSRQEFVKWSRSVPIIENNKIYKVKPQALSNYEFVNKGYLSDKAHVMLASLVGFISSLNLVITWGNTRAYHILL